MSGVVPLSDPDSQADFLARLDEHEPNLTSFDHAAEAFDAVVLIALAAEAAASDAPGAIATRIVDVSAGGETCSSYPDCRDLIHKGADIDYDGVSGFVDLLDDGEAARGTFAVRTVGADGRLARDVTTYLEVEAPEGAGIDAPRPTPAAGAPADRVLRIATLLPPATGGLAPLGPQAAGVSLAVEEINAADGVLKAPIQLVAGTADTASLARVTGGGIDAVVGLSTDDAVTSLGPALVAANIPVLSPAATASSGAGDQDRGLLFRLAPSDSLQADALVQLIAGDGFSHIVVLTPRSPDPRALADAVARGFVATGGRIDGKVPLDYDPTENPEAVVGRVRALDPEAVLLTGGEDTLGILAALTAAGSESAGIPLFATDRALELPFPELMGPG